MHKIITFLVMNDLCGGGRSEGSHHHLLIGFIDVRVVRPAGLGVGVPHHLRCAVVLIQKPLRIQLICVFI